MTTRTRITVQARMTAQTQVTAQTRRMAGTRVTMETASDHSQVTMKTTGIAKTMNHDQKRRCAISCHSAVTQPLFCKIKACNFVSKKNDKAKCHKTKQNNDGRQPSIKIKIPKRNTKTNPTEVQVREAIAKMVAKKVANANLQRRRRQPKKQSSRQIRRAAMQRRRSGKLSRSWLPTRWPTSTLQRRRWQPKKRSSRQIRRAAMQTMSRNLTQFRP